MQRTVIIALVLMCIPLGCTNMAYKGEHLSNDTSLEAGQWPFGPVGIRLHPFTQIGPVKVESSEKNADDTIVVEARVELVDQLGDVTKGVGMFRFELYDTGASAAHRGEELRLQKWEAPLLTLEQNKQQYDSITRTYWFRLPLDEAPPTNHPLKLTVQFTDQTQLRLMADIRLSYKPK